MTDLLFDTKAQATNFLGGFATVASASVATVQDNEWQAQFLFWLSAIVGVLTAIHMILQIRAQFKKMRDDRLEDSHET
jgi:hypothetical protein